MLNLTTPFFSKISIAFLIVLPYFNIKSQTPTSLPNGFKEFKKSPSDGATLQPLITDFDKDGRKDYITVVHNRTYDDLRSNQKYLYIYLSHHKKAYLFDFNIADGTYFLQPQIKNKTLEFQLYSEGTSNRGHLLKWRFNPKKENIELIGLDFSYRVPGGHCFKSLNLLTRKYFVTNDYYDFKSKKTKVETFKALFKFNKSLTLESTTASDIHQLTLIGKEYERQ